MAAMILTGQDMISKFWNVSFRQMNHSKNLLAAFFSKNSQDVNKWFSVYLNSSLIIQEMYPKG